MLRNGQAQLVTMKECWKSYLHKIVFCLFTGLGFINATLDPVIVPWTVIIGCNLVCFPAIYILSITQSKFINHKSLIHLVHLCGSLPLSWWCQGFINVIPELACMFMNLIEPIIIHKVTLFSFNKIFSPTFSFFNYQSHLNQNFIFGKFVCLNGLLSKSKSAKELMSISLFLLRNLSDWIYDLDLF